MLRSVVPALLCLLVAACTDDQKPVQPQATTPNIILITADGWRGQALGAAGDPNVITPHLDSMYRHGVAFTNAIASVPMCSPARASLFTGTRPMQHKVLVNDKGLSAEATTLAEAVGDSYYTAFIGKWHLDGQGRKAFTPPGPRRQGFRYWKAIETTHNYWKSAYFADTDERQFWHGYDAIAQTADALEFLNDRSDDGQPFLLCLSWGPPHSPYGEAPEDYQRLYAPDQLQLRPNIPDSMEAYARESLAGYYAHCTALDAQIGRIGALLRKKGLDKNTIVAFTGDHGDMIGSHGQTDKQQPWDESIRVPLLFCGAGLAKAGRELPHVASHKDVMPTLLGHCGIAIPPAVTGTDYSQLMSSGFGNDTDTATLIASYVPTGRWAEAGGFPYRGIRTPRYTYAESLDGSKVFVYDNQADPFQQNNLATDSNHVSLQSHLKALTNNKLSAQGDMLLSPEVYQQRFDLPVQGRQRSKKNT